MKYLLTVVFSIGLLLQVSGQSKSELSLGPNFSGLLGLTLETSYKHLITERIGVVGRVAYNFDRNYNLRAGLGLSYRVIDYKGGRLDAGLEYNFDKFKNTDQRSEGSSHNIEIPLTVSFNMSPRYRLFAGAAAAINLNNFESSELIDVLRVGVTYTW